jgi:uncharacterized membrane protein YfcA
MTHLTLLLLTGTGVFAGMIASIVGGAAVVVYPAMIMAGVSPQFAAVSNLVALMPATMLAALSDRSQLPPFNRAFIGLIFASVLGAGAGAMLLLVTPQHLFNGIVPLLLGFATLLFAYAEKIGAYIRQRAAGRGHDVSFSVSSLKVLLPVSFYGGYFGAGVGILVLGVFSIATGGDYRSANVAKNLVTGLNGLVASIVFIAHGAVVWPQTLALMAGTVGGGLLGAQIARIIPRKVVRVLIIAVGTALTVSFARRYWFA